MKLIEKILVVIAVIGVILLFSQGETLLASFGLLLLSCLYYVGGFALLNNIALRDLFNRSAYANTSALTIVGAVVVGISLAILLVGVLFKLMLWPGSRVQLTVGLVTMGIMGVAAAYFYLKTKRPFYREVLIRVFLLGGIGLAVYVYPATRLVDLYYGDWPEYAAKYKEALADPKNGELWQELEDMFLEKYQEK